MQGPCIRTGPLAFGEICSLFQDNRPDFWGLLFKSVLFIISVIMVFCC